MIAWEKLKKKDLAPISAIARRAVVISITNGYCVDYETMSMDISACHISNPLDLPGLLSAAEGDFCHDVFGIRKYINRETGKLTDCFSPRFSL